MKHRSLSISLFAVFTLLPPLAAAALRYDVNIEVIREDETEYFAERVTADGNNARVDFLDSDGNPDGSYMVTNNAGKTIIVHDGGKSICSEWDRADFFHAAGKMLDKGQRMVNATISDVKTVVLSEEPGPDIEGYKTRHVRLRTDYTGRGRFLFIKVSYSVEELDDIWVTSGLQVPEIEAGWLEAASRTGNEFLDKHAEEWIEKTEGVILKHSNIVRLTNVKSGETEEKTEHLTVTNIQSLEASELPGDLFGIPACKKVKQSEMLHQAERMLKKYIK